MPRVNVALMRSMTNCTSSSVASSQPVDDALHAVVGKQPRELLRDVLADVAALGFGRLLLVRREVGIVAHWRSIPPRRMGDIGKPIRVTQRPAPVTAPPPGHEPAPAPPKPPTAGP